MAAPKTADQEFNERYDGVGVSARDASDTRRRLAGSDRVARKDSTRNARSQARTSTMPGAPKNDAFATDKRDIATEFNESYAKKGIQPSYAANDNQAPKGRYAQPEQITRSEQYQQVQEEVAPPPKQKKTYKRRKKLRKKLGPKSAFAKARVTGINVWVWSWGLFTWTFFQLPFALGSIAFLALHQAIHLMLAALTPREDGNWFVKLANEVVGRLFDTLYGAAKYLVMLFWGIDLDYISPINIGLALYAIVLVFGWFTLMLIYFMYKASFLNPLGGHRASLKIGTFLIAFVGYAIPIANLFPWFIFWTMAVWWSPK